LCRVATYAEGSDCVSCHRKGPVPLSCAPPETCSWSCRGRTAATPFEVVCTQLLQQFISKRIIWSVGCLAGYVHALEQLHASVRARCGSSVHHTPATGPRHTHVSTSPPRFTPKPTHTGRRAPGAMEDVNRRARKEAFIHSRRHMCLPYARDTLGGSRHDSRNGSESVENVLKHGDLLYFLPGLAFVVSFMSGAHQRHRQGVPRLERTR
jgi:hypothetical protein